MILDDQDLDKQTQFRIWREDSRQLAAIRIFGGPRERSEALQSKAFPPAFRNTKRSPRLGASATPPQRQIPTMTLLQASGAASNQPPPLDLSGSRPTSYKGALFHSVRTMLGLQEKDTWVADPERIAREGIPLEKFDSLLLPDDFDPDPPYAPRTP